MGTKPKVWTRRDAQPYEVGNRASVRHGVLSKTLVSERSQRILVEFMERWPWLEDCDAVMVEELCRNKALNDMAWDHIEGVINGTVKAYPTKGRPRTGIEGVSDRIWDVWHKTSRSLTDICSKLGFTAADRAVIIKDAAWAKSLGGQRLRDQIDEGARKRAERLAGLGGPNG